MRVPPPGTLKLDRLALLADVRERLADQLPQYRDAEADPTDPGWLLLEQAAWMVELLSEQLDQYPYAVVQQFVHMMGGHLRPARPSLGVLLCDVGTDGVMNLDPRRPSPWRFFTPQDEDMESVEFVPAESGVSFRSLELRSLCELRDEELMVVGPDATAEAQPMALWRQDARRSRVFGREAIAFVVVTNSADTVVEAANAAIELLNERHIGWVRFSVHRDSDEQVTVLAEIVPEESFARAAPAGRWKGGDLSGDWGTLDESTWTPTVTIRNHPMLPAHLHHQFPLPGFEPNQILLMDIPENFAVAELLERQAQPVPESVVKAMWTTLANQESRLQNYRPMIKRRFVEFEDDEVDEPRWIAAAVESGSFGKMMANLPKTIAHLRLTSASKKKHTVRVAVVHHGEQEGAVPLPDVIPLKADGTRDKRKAEVSEAWRLALPPRDGSRVMSTVVAYDVDLAAAHRELLLVVSGTPEAVFANVLLVANMPAVADGRATLIERNIPTQVSMLHEDLVTPEVVRELLEGPISSGAADVMRRLALSHFSVPGADAVTDWAGVQIDASEGTVTLNAPDREGQYRVFRPGVRISFDWYRRTHGAAGNQPADRIRLVEQPPAPATPSLDAVTNPFATFYGASRELPEAAMDRMFGPTGGVPVLASDFERSIRQALGARGYGWHIRCWTYAERALVSTALWPFGGAGAEADAESERVRARLDKAGPETLLVVLGPPDGQMSDADLDWARRTVRAMVRRLAARLPVVREAVVTRFWPLQLEARGAPPTDIITPSYDLQNMDGQLRDRVGRVAASIPQATLVLNGAVTHVVGHDGVKG